MTNSIDWPIEPDEYVIKVITQDRALATAFNDMARKRQINGKPIQISFSNYISLPKGLHIIYVTEDYNNSLQSIIENISGDPILILTENSADQQYMMINMIETADGITFEYNKTNIINQGLEIRPEFEELGGKEINVAALYQQVKDSVEMLEQRSRSVEDQIDSLNILTAVAVKLGSTLLNQVGETKEEIVRQNESLESMRKRLRDREAQLLAITEQISFKKDSVRWGRMELIEQEALIGRRDREIIFKDKELKALVLIIENQLEILIFLIVFALLFLTALFLFYKAYKARRRDAKKLNEQRQELNELLEKVKSKQKQLIHAEKLAAVGELSESIAHEVNNASNYILSGIHIIDRRFSEAKTMMNSVRSLNEEDSNLKTKLKVRDLMSLKDEIEYDSYDSVMVKTISSIKVGADRVINVLKSLEPYFKYGELGKFGLALLGKDASNERQITKPTKVLSSRRSKRLN